MTRKLPNDAPGLAGGAIGGAGDGGTPKRSHLYLQPGQMVVTSQPCSVTTILGSCVAVCAWDPLLQVGGMNHYLLPYWAGGQRSSPRFGNVAIQRLVDGVLSLGSTTRTMRARIVGGACVIAAFQRSGKHLGLTNVDVATRMLGDLGVTVVTEDVGGQRGRKVTFQTDDGTLHVRLV